MKTTNPINQALIQNGFKQFNNKIFVVGDKMLLDAVIKIRKETTKGE